VLGRRTTKVGWFAQHGRVPLGYFGDAAKTSAPFPDRGDPLRRSRRRARYRPDGSMDVLGATRSDQLGRPKIFAEEVESALKQRLRSTTSW
jgi:fatty-acyl-CoA synthase